MKTTPGLAAEAKWKQLLRLGEDLLRQPSTAAQCRLINAFVQDNCGCQVQVWLATEFYPLPGETDILDLADENAPEIIREVLKYCQKCEDDQSISAENGLTAAIPLVTQENILGALLVSHPGGRTFSPDEISYLNSLGAHVAMALQISRQVTLKNWRNEQLNLVRLVSSKIANIFDLDQLCAQVTHLIQETFHYYSVAVFTLEDDNQHLLFRGSASLEQDRTSPFMKLLNTGEGIIGYVAETGYELLAPDVSLEPQYLFIGGLPDTRSEFALPLKFENNLLGVLDVQSEKLDSFHEHDSLVLRVLADNIAVAVENVRLYNHMKRHGDRIMAVFQISHALNSILELDELLKEMVGVIQKQFGYPFVNVFTVQPGRRKIVYQTGVGERALSTQANEISFDLDDPNGIIPHVVRSGRTYLAVDTNQDSIYRPSVIPPFSTRSELAVPLVYANETLGVLDIQSTQPGAFDQDDLSLFEALAASMAVAVRNATLYRAERWRRQVADSLHAVAGLLPTHKNIDELLDTILGKLESNLPCDASAIWLLDNNNSAHLHLVAARGVKQELLSQTLNTNPAAFAWLQQVLQTGQLKIRKADEPYGPLGAALGFPANYSSIATPLMAGDQPIGVLTLAHHTPGRYGHEASAITTTFTSYAAVAIQNTRLFQDAQEQAWVSTILLQVAEATQAIGAIDELLETVVRMLPFLIGVRKCAIFLRDENQGHFSLAASYGLEKYTTPQVFLEETAPALARLRAQPGPVFIQDAALELNLPTAAVPENTGTIVLLPLLARGNLLGALLISHVNRSHVTSDKVFDERTLAVLQGIAHQTSVALENLRLVETRQEESYVTAVLLQVSQAVVSLNELEDILDTIVHLMPILVGIDACMVYLWNDKDQCFKTAQVFTGSHTQENILLKHTYCLGDFQLLDAVYHSDGLFCASLTSGTMNPEVWPYLPSTPYDDFINQPGSWGKPWILGFPISAKGELFGVFLTQETSPSPSVREKRIEILTGVAQQIALAIQNDRYNQQMVERERMEHEFSLARQIQRSFLPSQIPTVNDWELDYCWQTARQVGGDFYDMFKLDHDHLGLVIADVSDKGLPAALYMTVTRTMIRSKIRTTHSPAAVLRRVNNLLLNDTENSMFVTAIYAVIDLKTGQMVYANAGHNRPLIVHSGAQVETLPQGGMAMGVLKNSALKDYQVTLQAGDTLIFYTDGVTDNFSPAGEAFGEKRLLQVLQNSPGKSAKTLLDKIDQALDAHRAGLPLSDDITLLALHRNDARPNEPN